MPAFPPQTHNQCFYGLQQFIKKMKCLVFLYINDNRPLYFQRNLAFAYGRQSHFTNSLQVSPFSKFTKHCLRYYVVTFSPPGFSRRLGRVFLQGTFARSSTTSYTTSSTLHQERRSTSTKASSLSVISSGSAISCRSTASYSCSYANH